MKNDIYWVKMTQKLFLPYLFRLKHLFLKSVLANSIGVNPFFNLKILNYLSFLIKKI
eukprot:TRINITY_DN10969_c0_g1_i1.p1 TRINITY_DN10969_c0_g1~~TRINITY_DN10969_c0_g1_i1.p1  ORF type:complete len:57 (-),score=13.01 TRINITY_DN10969_c0_g1_i1:73-243(-)